MIHAFLQKVHNGSITIPAEFLHVQTDRGVSSLFIDKHSSIHILFYHSNGTKEGKVHTFAKN